MYKRDVVMFDLVSLTVGISGLPLGHRLTGYAHPLRQLLLRHAACHAAVLQIGRKIGHR